MGPRVQSDIITDSERETRAECGRVQTAPPEERTWAKEACETRRGGKSRRDTERPMATLRRILACSLFFRLLVPALGFRAFC